MNGVILDNIFDPANNLAGSASGIANIGARPTNCSTIFHGIELGASIQDFIYSTPCRKPCDNGFSVDSIHLTRSNHLRGRSANSIIPANKFQDSNIHLAVPLPTSF